MEETAGNLGFSKPVPLGPMGHGWNMEMGRPVISNLMEVRVPGAPCLAPILRVLVSSVFMAELGLGMLHKSMLSRSFLISSFSQK